MASIEIAIDLGSSYTSVFLSGNGVVLHEPTIAAFVDYGKSNKLLAWGTKAKVMTGKVPERTTLIEPIAEGIIFDKPALTQYLRQLLKKITEAYLFPPRIRAVATIPCGLTVDERKDYEDVMLSAGIKNITLVDGIIASAAGCDLPIESSECGFVVNIGGGITDIAALSLCGIVNGCSVNVGGKHMDMSICEHVFSKHNMQIGIYTAEKLKEEIGSLLLHDTAAMQVSGLDAITKKPVSASISANDVLEAVLPHYYKIAKHIETVINVCPPEIAALIQKTGIVLTGGGANILGLEQLFASSLKLPIAVSSESKYTGIKGAGKLLNDEQLLQKVLNQN